MRRLSNRYRRRRWTRNIELESLETRCCLTTTVVAATIECCRANGIADFELADLDGDGDVDIISALGNDNRIVWHENLDGQGTFGQQRTIAAEVLGAASVAAADLDLDGDLDVISASGRDQQVAWYENLGHRRFSSRQVIDDSGTQVYGLQAHDLDADGDTDLVVAFRGENSIVWYENHQHESTFQRHLVTQDALNLVSLVAADLDGDNDVDLASLTNDGQRSGKLSWYMNRGEGSFSSRRVVAGQLDQAYSAIAADVYGDSKPDLVASAKSEAADWPDEHVATYANPDRYFKTRFRIAEVDGYDGIGAADVNGDGFNDLLTFDRREKRVDWYQHPGQDRARFAGPFSISQDELEVSSMETADIDRDGDLDIVVASYYDDQIAWYPNLDGAGHFGDARVVSSPNDPITSLFEADLNQDGQLDLVAASELGRTVGWYANLGDAVFDDYRQITPALAPVAGFAIDVDGDDDLDIVLGSQELRQILWVENVDNGLSFQAPKMLVDDVGRVNNVIAADFNHDGLSDIITVTNGGFVSWYAAESNSAFADGVLLANVGVGEFQLATADLDLDDDLDVIVTRASTGQGSVVWLENRNEEAAVLHTVTESISEPTAIVAADFDADGNIDLAVAGFGRVTSFINLGSGQFDEATVTEQEFAASDLVATDFDSDGDLDLIVASATRDRVAWYENENNNGIETQRFELSGIVGNQLDRVDRLVVGDFTGNGHPDVAASSRGSGRISVHAQRLIGDSNHDGRFSSSDLVIAFQSGTFGYAIESELQFEQGDWNQDGRFDTSDLVYAFQNSVYEDALDILPILQTVWAHSPTLSPHQEKDSNNSREDNDVSQLETLASSTIIRSSSDRDIVTV